MQLSIVSFISYSLHLINKMQSLTWAQFRFNPFQPCKMQNVTFKIYSNFQSSKVGQKNQQFFEFQMYLFNTNNAISSSIYNICPLYGASVSSDMT